MMTTHIFRELDKRAVLASVRAVARVRPDHLELPTPCAGWTLKDLLEHMTAQHYGFAAAAAGRGANPLVWQVAPLGPDPLGEYTKAASHVIEAFAADGVAERQFTLPEISTAATFPAEQAVSFHFIDYVVHGWDVARTIGVSFELDPLLAETALEVAERVPDGPERLRDGAAFRPAVSVPAGASELDRILAMLGRSPNWPARPALLPMIIDDRCGDSPCVFRGRV